MSPTDVANHTCRGRREDFFPSACSFANGFSLTSMNDKSRLGHSGISRTTVQASAQPGQTCFSPALPTQTTRRSRYEKRTWNKVDGIQALDDCRRCWRLDGAWSL